ncbi:MAG: dihydrofolate reductase family protein [Janthinobacterium lividum]
MRKLVAALYLSLDGVMEHPAWTAPFFNEELGQLQGELMAASGALVLGRVTYEGFAAAWPAMPDAPGADIMNRLPKHVATRSLTELTWNAARLPGDDVVAAVAHLKQQAGPDLLLYGSGELADALRHAGLIDEYWLMVFPVVVGSGKRFFREGAGSLLRLAGSQTTSTGVSVLTYVPA